ncbi:MAG TPA: hypothetical protein VNJ03_11915 [Vicinamibacterales bacterium]|nr:hypothetical protein [Vicinamibacterales bacterium]
MRQRVLVLVCVLLVTASACSRKQAVDPPVATPSVTFSKDKAAIGSPLKITYKFEVLPNASFDADHVAFVHIMDPDGEKLWQDDHAPTVPTSQWKPGQVIEYTRTVFVPNYPYIGEAVVRIGLYNPANGKRLTLNAPEASRQEYVAGKLQLLPQSENVFLIYKEGWHPQEVAPDDPITEWQWTKKRGTISFRNPGRDATFYLEWDARIDLFTPPQQVTVTLAGQPIGAFQANSKDRTLTSIPIAAAQFGSVAMAEIAVEVDRAFTPGGGADTRELGIRVFHAFIEPK